MWGKINLYKEADMSSQQAVTRLRRLLGIKKIGHSGTLDPMATGVLNCFVSQATKFIDLLPEEVKVYQADFILGQTSDTLDIWGNITSKPFVSPTERELKEELGKFIGESFQIPPMYSAIKYKGQALYHYARQGIEIPRKKRKININKLELINFDGKKGSIRIHCSRGTYIRTLIDDLGQNLGTGAIMSGLVREHNDWAGLKDCYSLKEIEAMLASNNFDFLESIDKNIDLPRYKISRENYADLINGRTKNILLGKGQGRILLYYNGLFVGTGLWNEGILQREKLIQVEYDS